MRIINEKLKIIYRTKETYTLWFAAIICIVCTRYFSKSIETTTYFQLYNIDFFLWLIIIPVIVSINKSAIFVISYDYLSRVKSKRHFMRENCIVIFISTLLLCCFLFFLPVLISLGLQRLSIQAIGTEAFRFYFMFYFLRYLVIILFAQYIVFVLTTQFYKLRKNNVTVYFIPIVLYFILSLPRELLTANGKMSFAAIDFSAGNTLSVLDESFLSFTSIIMNNLHIIVYIICLLYIVDQFIIDKAEFLEGEKNV